ncbi:hypothetical protein GQ43DRAFT_461366 [Delitschia confertaspora ATCC 74209]|uniref:Uncharacterized protein n=1 Tax=Delitschia confertaspora ATCC 74209 TaxID=1513339 RepID=A0A9P4JW77_9PLEO|nr:hypothetical protein GQ43DRAFT_461366 [Delitschia confertaspora ATCC 74209]
MSGFIHFLKTMLIPLFVSLLLYFTLTHIALPLYRRHRSRYSQYNPLPTFTSSLPSLSASTPFRQRLSDALRNLFFPSTWRQPRHIEGHNDEDHFDDGQGEGMASFEIDERRREALEQRRSMMGEEDSGRRLSRELEEGFRDDSEDEVEEGGMRGGTICRV